MFEVVTAITLTVIGIILTLYFIVLKRKGWLREDSQQSSPFYRCPNPECRKIFNKPTVLTDLSNNATVHSACPHCGFDLKTVSPSRISKKLKAVETPLKPEEPMKRVEASKITTEKQSGPPTEKQSGPATKSLQVRPPECRHFYGYLKKIPKNTSIPDECFGCLRMVDCLYYDVMG
jgi:hypothetical protein